MSIENKNERLISIDEVILRAERLGVDFGKGNPRERLRYLTKIGLLPHAQRKSFNGGPPNGAYPEKVIELLIEIDKKIKAGKSIQDLKKEKTFLSPKIDRDDSLKASSTHLHPVFPEIIQPKKETPQTREDLEIKKSSRDSKLVLFPPRILERLSSVLKIVFLIFIFGGIVFLLSNQEIVRKNFFSYLSASFSWVQKVAQVPRIPIGEIPTEDREVFLPISLDPYLTINAETDINASLNVRDGITAPSLSLLREGFEGALISGDLTTDRTYTFPDLSGVVCLTTGNCVGLGGEVFSPAGGVPDRLARFITSQEIGVSSIEDFYPDVALTIDSIGQIGIGIRNPDHTLHVDGRIQATGDICTDLAGGRCLSTLLVGGVGGARGVGGSGTTNYLPIWTDSTRLGDSIMSQSGSLIDVDGTIRVTGFQLPTGANENYILTSDDEGRGTWRALPSDLVPSGEFGQTLRFGEENWLADSFLYNTGTSLGIGTTSTLATLNLSGNAIFSSMTLPQFLLRYGDSEDDYLSFSINGDQSLIEASKRLTLNSITGEIVLGENVDFFGSFGSEIRGATFVSASDDSTVREVGELVFRASVPIFRFSLPAQTTTTVPTAVSKTFSLTDSLSDMTPPQLPGTERVYSFLINFADNIETTSNSQWSVYRPEGVETVFSFDFPGQQLDFLERGNPYLTATTTLPDNDWQLQVRSPSANNSIRIFNIFLLVFDQIVENP